MRTRTFPLGEVVTLFYLTALVLVLSLVGCSPEPETTAEARPVAVQPKPAAPPAPPRAATESPAPEVRTPVTYQEAEEAFSVGDYERASELFTQYVDRKPDNPWGHYMRGLAARKAGDLQTAELALLDALHLDSTHVKSWQNLARVHLDAGLTQPALSAIAEAELLDGGSNANLRLLGRAYHQQGNLQEAADAYRDAILADESDAWAMNNLALVLLEQDRDAQALAALAQAARLKPTVALFQNNLGMALEHNGYIRDAEEAYSAAVRLDEDYERASANLDRVAAVAAPFSGTVDLTAQAAAFMDEVATWRDEYVSRELGELPATSEATRH